ncbi:hypothetical protein MTO96_035095 [Rhipicephalus appendiculatus]
MTSRGVLLAVFCVAALHAVSSLRIVGHAIGGSETLEREKFDISSKADNDSEGDDFKAVPTPAEKAFEAEAERSDPVSDASKAMQKALGNAVAEFLPGARSDSHP